MQLSYGLRLPTDLRYVSVVRRLCTTTLGELGVEQGSIDDIALAVTEACANVVKHARTQDDFEVAVSVDGRVATIEVIDAGTGFDPALAEAMVRDPDDPLTHGRGLGLMRVLVDDLHFEPDEGGMRVVLVKVLDLVPESVLA